METLDERRLRRSNTFDASRTLTLDLAPEEGLFAAVSTLGPSPAARVMGPYQTRLAERGLPDSL